MQSKMTQSPSPLSWPGCLWGLWDPVRSPGGWLLISRRIMQSMMGQSPSPLFCPARSLVGGSGTVCALQSL